MNIPNNLDVWVMAGQSNMDGNGLLNGSLKPDERVLNFTSAIDLGLDDLIHLSADSLIRLGRRLARLALHLTGQPSIPACPKVERIEVLEPAKAFRIISLRADCCRSRGR